MKTEKQKLDGQFEKEFREELETLAETIERCNLETNKSSKVAQ